MTILQRTHQARSGCVFHRDAFPGRGPTTSLGWEKTRHVRFQHDIVNGFYWGSETLAEARKLSPNGSSAESWPAFFRGYLALYDRVKDDAYEDDYGLDYPPLRLLAMSVWAKQVRSEFPGVDSGMARP
jgi:hypothetical protein